MSQTRFYNYDQIGRGVFFLVVFSLKMKRRQNDNSLVDDNSWKYITCMTFNPRNKFIFLLFPVWSLSQ